MRLSDQQIDAIVKEWEQVWPSAYVPTLGNDLLNLRSRARQVVAHLGRDTVGYIPIDVVYLQELKTALDLT